MSNQLSSSLHLPARLPRPRPTLEAVELGQRLRKLSRRTLQIFLLSRVDGQPYADIALFMDVEVARVERA
ncbi:sigma-70 region 4 domain-containing protein, partial [Pseudomonas syringae]